MAENTIIPISYTEVIAAAESLAAAGDKITVIAIREKLGRGSFTTIKKFLDRSRETNPDQQAHPSLIPPQLESLWLEARKAADEALASERDALNQMASELEQRFEKLQAEAMNAEHNQRAVELRLADKEAELAQTYVQIADLKMQRSEVTEQLNGLLAQRSDDRTALQDNFDNLMQRFDLLEKSAEQLQQSTTTSMEKLMKANGAETRMKIVELIGAESDKTESQLQRFAEKVTSCAEPLTIILSHVEQTKRLVSQVRRIQHWPARAAKNRLVRDGGARPVWGDTYLPFERRP